MSELKVNSRLLGLKGVEVHVDDHGGTGRPVVLIHGWPLSGASWSEQIEALTDAGFRVVTYDRRGFGRSDKPKTGYDYDYDYDTLADDLAGLITQLDLHDVTLVGFSMGGGEVARYLAKHGEDRLHSVVFAAAVTPMMINTPGNPGGPLEKSKAADMTAQLTKDQDAFYDQFYQGVLLCKRRRERAGLRGTAPRRPRPVSPSRQGCRARGDAVLWVDRLP